MTVGQIDTAQMDQPHNKARKATPWPRLDRDQAVLFRIESSGSADPSPSSAGSRSAESARLTYDHLPTQLSRLVEALKFVKESAAALSSRQEPPSREEAAAVVIEPCEMIIRDLLAASETYSQNARRTEEHTKAQLLAGITAFLHSWE